MSVEDEDQREINSQQKFYEMSEKDKVLVVVGNWERLTDGKWTFEPTTVEGTRYVCLTQRMRFSDLVDTVKRKLGIRAKQILLKLTYQYPDWMAIDQDDGLPPQYITEDADVEAFFQMRRQIEEVNLFVIVSQRCEAGTKVLRGAELTELAGNIQDISDDVSMYDSDEEWDAFALEEATRELAMDEMNVVEQVVIPRTAGGITIHEGGGSIRLTSQHCAPGDKGKDLLVSDGDSSQTERMVQEIRMIPVSQHHLQPGLIAGDEEVGEHSVPASGSPSKDGGDEWEGDARRGDVVVWGRAEQALHEFLSDNSTDPTLFWRDAPPVFNDTDDTGIDSAVFDINYEGDKLFLGRVFKSKGDCKLKISLHAISRKFHFRTPRSTPKFMVMECVCRTCPWRVYAARMKGSQNFQIRQITMTHRCTVDDRRNYHKLATTQLIGSIMSSKFIGIKKGPNPAAIRKGLIDDYHVNVSYWKSWRSREIAMETSLGSVAGSYSLIPIYLNLLKVANPGSLCFLEYENIPGRGKRFKYSFISFAASIRGYEFMRKVIVVDGTSLKARYGGCLISACAQDANFQIFPLAFGIVDSENDAAWEWFFRRLSTFVVDSSIYVGLQRLFPLAHHAACTVHLWRNVKDKFKQGRLASAMYQAARAYTMSEFNRKFVEIQNVSPGCAAYLIDIGFAHWTRSYFTGRRYNIMDSNIAESWNSVIKEAREFPLICMLEYIRTTVMNWFAIRRAKANKEKGSLTPRVRALVEENYDKSGSLLVRPISLTEFQVQSAEGGCFVVKLLECTCSCMEFQTLGIPCAHALAAATRAGISTDVMVHPGYFAETWGRSYAEKIYPIPSVGGDDFLGEVEEGDEGELLPPNVKRPPGRPKKIRIPSRGEFKGTSKKTLRRCTRCLGLGHNRASCRKAM